MTTRRALSAAFALVAVTATVAAPGALAAPRPRPLPTTCKLLTDPTGDGGSRIYPLNARPTDVVEVDLASGAKTVKVVMKTQSLDTNSDPQTMNGAIWAVMWEIGATSYSVDYSVGFQGANGNGRFNVDKNAVADARPTVTFDRSTSTITWVVDRKWVPSFRKTGQKFIRIGFSTTVNAPVAMGADAGTSDKTYIDRQPSCLKPA